MNGVFKANNPYNYLLLFIYGLVLKLNFFINPSMPAFSAFDGFFYTNLLGAAVKARIHPLVFSAIAFSLLFLQAIVINEIATKQRLFPRNNYLPGMTYLLITSLFPEWQVLSSPLIANSLLIWILSRLFKMHMAISPKTIVYNTGLLAAAVSLVYYPSAFFLAPVIIGIAFSRPFILQEWVTLLLGLATPYYFTFAWFYLSDEWKDIAWQQTRLLVPDWRFLTIGYVAVILMGISLAAGIFYLKKYFSSYLMQTRKSWVLVIFFLLTSCSLAFLSGPVSPQRMLSLPIGLSLIVSCAFFYPVRNWFPFILHWCLALAAIVGIWFI